MFSERSSHTTISFKLLPPIAMLLMYILDIVGVQVISAPAHLLFLRRLYTIPRVQKLVSERTNEWRSAYVPILGCFALGFDRPSLRDSEAVFAASSQSRRGEESLAQEGAQNQYNYHNLKQHYITI